MPNHAQLSPGLALEIAGLPGPDLIADLISLRFVESLARDGLIEATLNNWGGSPPGFKYSDGTAVQPGAKVRLSCGTATLATATITAVAPHFNANGVPTLAFTATAPRPDIGPATTLPLAFGGDLLAFNPVLQSTGSPRRPALTATGLASGLPTLRAGVHLNINGVGTHWSGSYAVSEATHSFDLQQGYRVAFACSR